jgi:hypothetical protein
MKGAPRFTTQRLLLATVVVFLTVLSVTLNRASAQDGDNAICTTTACTGTGIFASSAFIDASAFCSTGGSCTTSDDFCSVVNTALTKLPTAGGVVDARGVMTSTGISCTSTTTPMPFTGITTPSTVLLPAGKITISHNWILPDRTRIIGQGNNPQNGTQLFVVGSGFTGTDMIEMGNSSCDDGVLGQCYGVSVEYLLLEGQGVSGLNGIVNQYSGPSSYVDHVNFHQLPATSLTIEGNATDSGPYSNLAVSSATKCVAATACVQLGDSNGKPLSTRGIHGMTCTCTGTGASGGTGKAGILLNSPNNTLEDIHFEGFIDGLQVGSLVPATGKTIQTQGNVVLSVNGGGNNKDTMTNVVHVCAPSTCGNTNNTNNVVSDLTLVATASSRSCTGCTVTNVIVDDLTSTTIASSTSVNTTTIGMYALGDQMSSSGGAYSRFSTSPVAPVPTWGVGGSPPSTSTSCQSGSLFSNTGGGSGGTGTGYTLWVCSGGTWTKINH